MRIALVTTFRSKIGGTETYVELLGFGLRAAGHEIALWHERDGDADRGMIAVPAGTPVWSAQGLGQAAALEQLGAWRPDVILSHGCSTAVVEAAVLAVAPTVLFEHAYNGACISGGKSRLSPTRTPCSRPLGWPCLLHYFPRRCGGLNPATMMRRYAHETERRDMFVKYRAVLTASRHMRAEILRYGVSEDRVHAVGLMLARDHEEGTTPKPAGDSRPGSTGPGGHSSLASEWRLLFVSRLTNWKGGAILLKALPLLREHYGGRIVVTIAGEGPDRASLERRAAKVHAECTSIEIQFAGWLQGDALSAAMNRSDLLVVPSVWPEPFGLVGPEAGLHALPAAAFAVGGIPDWLVDGLNGHLAPGDPPTARGLADAIIESLRDPEHHARLRSGARARAEMLSADRHIPALVSILARAAAPSTGVPR